MPVASDTPGSSKLSLATKVVAYINASDVVAHIYSLPDPESPPQEPTNGSDASAQPLNSVESPDHAAPSASSHHGEAVHDASAANAATSQKKQRIIPIPSRTSSKVDKQSTLENAQKTARDESENTSLSPKRSILNRRRDRSRGSSKRSRRQNDNAANIENSKPEAISDPGQAPTAEKKPKTSSRLFACFGCCSSSDLDAEDTVPPAKRTVRPAMQNSQPTPEKVGPQPGDSGTAERKEPSYIGDEKSNRAVVPNQSHATVAEKDHPSGQHVQYDGAVASPDRHAPDHAKESSEKNGTGAGADTVQMAPVAPAAVDAATMSEKIDDPTQTVEQDVGASTAHTPEGPISEPDPLTSPLPEDAPIDESPKADGEEDEANSPGLPLPPPPPLAPGQQMSSAPPTLLPPPLPHLGGRKCLVLDLDETLVHSSFKVCLPFME